MVCKSVKLKKYDTCEDADLAIEICLTRFSEKKLFIRNKIHKFASLSQKRVSVYRDVAQLVAHYVRDVGVGRSSRLYPT